MESRNEAARVVVDAREKFVDLRNKLAVNYSQMRVATKQAQIAGLVGQSGSSGLVKLNRSMLERLQISREYIESAVNELIKIKSVLDAAGIPSGKYATGLNLAYSTIFEIDQLLDYAPNRRLLEFVEQREIAKSRGAK